MIKPKSRQVIIDPIYDSDYYNPSSQLIKIPEFAKDRCDQGTIYSMGSDCDPDLKIGMHVMFSGYTGTTIGVDNHVYILMHGDFIKAYFTQEDNPVIPGLFFRDKFGDTFPSNHNEVIMLVNQVYNDRNINIKKDEHITQRDKFDERGR